MNGTSLDGVDYVLCSWNSKNRRLKVQDRASRKFPRKLQEQLNLCAKNKANTETLSLTHFQLGKMYENHIKQLIISKDWKVDYVAVHGQTVFHEGGKASLQIGEVSYISKNLGLPTIYDFRSGDIALGGQGAPLAGLFHEHLYSQLPRSGKISFHNLGGISNLTYIHDKEKQCFDTGPANMPMDMFLKKYSKGEILFDRNGTIASKGKVDSLMLEKMLTHKYFRKKPPKSTGREDFGEEFLKAHYKHLKKLGIYNALATLNWFVAFSIFEAYRKFLPDFPDKIYLYGGGARNKALVKNLKDLFMGNSEVHTVEEIGIGVSDMEAMAFAFLGVSFLENKKLSLPDHTGAKVKQVLGKLSI